MLGALHVPRFALGVALARRDGLGADAPIALGPEPGGQPIVGEPSAAASAAGVRAAMRLSEAYALCPGLVLVPPDPVATGQAAERLLAALEELGLAVEPIAPGRALFDIRPVERLYGGLPGTLDRIASTAGRVMPLPVRLGVAPTRLGALAAARRARRHRPLVVRTEAVRETLAPLPLEALVEDAGLEPRLVRALDDLGVRRLGELAALDRIAVRDRFGPEGARAWLLAAGRDEEPVRPRPYVRRIIESLVLPEPAATEQALDHALRILVERILARPERAGRAPRSARLLARLVGGGSWERAAPLREPTADPDRLLLALRPRLRLLPAPAEVVALALGDLAPAERQEPLFREEGVARAGRLAEASRQVRSAVAPDAALRIVDVDAASRLPERRFGLVPR